MGRSFVEVRIETGVDRDELAALLSERECLGGWETPGALHLFWSRESWHPSILSAIRRAVLQLGGSAQTVIETAEIADADWNARWASCAQPILIGGRVLVRQSWNAVPPPAGGIELVIDPKRAFGSGYHSTTQLLVEWLLDLIRGGERVLDAGTGSAILAMTALRLGASRAVGIDSDPEAIECARENAVLNGFGPELELHVSGIETWDGGKSDLVLANLDRNTLLRHASELCRCVADSGRILVTGIQREDLTEIESAFGSAAFGVVELRASDEWIALQMASSPNRDARQAGREGDLQLRLPASGLKSKD